MLRARRSEFRFPTEAPGPPASLPEPCEGDGPGDDGARRRSRMRSTSRSWSGSPRSMWPRRRGWCARGCRIRPGRGSGGPGSGRSLPPRTRSSSWASTWRVRGSRRSPWSPRRITGGPVLPAGSGRPGRAAGQGPGRQARPRQAEKRQAGRVWQAKLTERGMLRPSFVPPAEIRQLRDYTRLRVDLTRDRPRHVQRLEKLLEDALIKLSTVATDIMGAVGPGDDRGADRRAARPAGAGRAGPRPDEGQARRAGAGPDRPVRRSPRRAGPDAAGPVSTR